MENSRAGTHFVDKKRYLWLLSLLLPAAVGAGPTLLVLTGAFWTLWLPAIFVYAIVPLIDWLLGEDTSNPPESAVPQLDADPYYRRITYALVPVLWVAFISINLGHELGHKGSRVERWLAKLVLALCAYGHFFIEHNRGHHRDVATPLDPASARMGESIYRFMLREIPGAARRAWLLEAGRLRGQGLPVWSLQNEILQPAMLTLLLWSSLIAWLGWPTLPFLIGVSFWSWFQLTSANYVEHYGLLRGCNAQGRYEACQPHHSWNSNHLFSNWVLFHLQRHSDHHAHPLRRYQSLRQFDQLPQLPSGYFGMFVLAYIPPLWFRVMDKRLLQAVQQDPARINFQPGLRLRLVGKYGLAA